jgi:hypothetical protein
VPDNQIQNHRERRSYLRAEFEEVESLGQGEVWPAPLLSLPGDKGGNRFAEGVTYNLYCKECGEKAACYKGETGRNGYTCGLEHLDSLAAQSEEKSVLWLHSVHHHQGREDVSYSMRGTGAFRDTLDRQVMERVNISNFGGPVLMNRRNEMGGFRVERTQYRRWGGD